MKKYTIYLICNFISIFFIGFIMLTSCNCHTEATGMVVDKITNQPLKDVEVSIYLSTIHKDSLQNPIFTDEKGHYKLTHNFCSDYMISFHKEGYFTFITSIKPKDSIYLEVYKEEEN